MTRVEWNRAALDRFIDDVGREVVGEAARRGADRARGFAPVLSGDYVAGIDHRVDVDTQGPVGRVIGGHWSSHFVEFGTPTVAAYAPLRNGVESLGLSLR